MPLIVIMTAFAVLFVLMVQAQGHTTEECQELDAKIEEWIEYEYWHGTSFSHLEILEELLVGKRRWCSPIVQERSFYSTNSGSPQSYGGGVEQWRGLVTTYFEEGKVETALCIILRESGGDPNIKNPRSSASGLFQHLARYWTERSTKAGWAGASIWDPEANIAVAAWLQRVGGWGHWTVYPLCRGL